jgi:GNAT superfamily N-acetyltransferase
MITFAIETFSSVYAELRPLLDTHYGEISTHKYHGVPLQPQIEVYRAREMDGSLLMAIGREAGKIVAYFICFIAPGLHYETCLTCSPDIFYVEPTQRGMEIGSEMFDFTENELRRRGVMRWAAGYKVQFSEAARRLFHKKGFVPVEVIEEKWLKG